MLNHGSREVSKFLQPLAPGSPAFCSELMIASGRTSFLELRIHAKLDGAARQPPDFFVGAEDLGIDAGDHAGDRSHR